MVPEVTFECKVVIYCYPTPRNTG
ncbi:hypothetical protein TNCV_4003401, partial [Trichonephila clavipes]